MYGMYVYRVVRNVGELEIGIIIYLVNEVYDEGDVFYQVKCFVEFFDIFEQIVGKVYQLEYEYFVFVIEKYIKVLNL